MNAPRVLIADDHDALSQSLVLLLGSTFEIVGTVTDGHRLVEAAVRLRPDVILTDISMPGLNGLDAVCSLKAAGSTAKVVILTMHADAELAAQAVRFGASGFVLKISAHDELATAITEVLQGRIYLSSAVAGQLDDEDLTSHAAS